MKRLVGALLAVGLLVLPAIEAQARQGDSKTKQVKGPGIEITPADHDFGKVEQNQKLETEFEIRNIGSEELNIIRISTTCGCTAALTSERLVKPGETTKLKVTLETRMYKGDIERSVSIATNAANKKISTVKVKAFVLEPNGEATSQ
jgi:Protein of unknown function (DUF1573)